MIHWVNLYERKANNAIPQWDTLSTCLQCKNGCETFLFRRHSIHDGWNIKMWCKCSQILGVPWSCVTESSLRSRPSPLWTKKIWGKTQNVIFSSTSLKTDEPTLRWDIRHPTGSSVVHKNCYSYKHTDHLMGFFFLLLMYRTRCNS